MSLALYRGQPVLAYPVLTVRGLQYRLHDPQTRRIIAWRVSPEIIEMEEEIPEIIEIPTAPTIMLTSRQDDNSTRNLGTIWIAEKNYSLPAEASVEVGERQIIFDPPDGYEFAEEWEISGEVEVTATAGISPLYFLRVRDDGTVTAVYSLVSPFRDCLIWEFTRYYKYDPPSRGRVLNARNFELKVWLPFLADWDYDDIKKMERELEDFCDNIMAYALFQDYAKDIGARQFDSNTWIDIYDKYPLKSELEIGWVADGWEETEETIELDIRKAYRADWEVIDKVGHYWKRPRTGWVWWSIPKEK